jgi:hypothetical protein
MKLSILICSLADRFDKLTVLLTELQRQASGKAVEVLWLGDFKGITVGEKRNKLLMLAKGDYVAFIDDDDMVSPAYVEEIVSAMKTNPDIICFECLYKNAQTGIENKVYFGRTHLNVNQDDKGIRYRMPNHLCAVKREIALRAKFTEKNFGEDSDYGYTLRNKFLLHSEVVIPKTLYYYNFNPKTSATWQYAPSVVSSQSSVVRHEPMVKMDLVIVGAGFTPALVQMTQQCVNSFASPQANIIVMEKVENIKYSHADTFLQPTPFNYNQCLNKGALKGNSEYICFSNNDIGVPQNFIDNAVLEMKARKLDVGGIKDQRGYSPAGCLTGWCFIMRRDAWLKIGRLNEDYTFYCSDNIVWKQVLEHGLKYGVLQNVYCEHGVSVTKNLLPETLRKEYTDGCVKRFNRENNTNLLNMGV